jgi:hypothetical protein
MALLKPEDPASPKILQLLGIAWGEIYPHLELENRTAKDSRARRLDFTESFLGRRVETHKALTMAEAVRLRAQYQFILKGLKQ